MKLFISSATVSIIQGSATVFADNSLVSSSVDFAYESSKSYLRRSEEVDVVSYQANECAFGIHAPADAGVLGCEAGFTCVQDKSSSTGGRCASIEEERELQTCAKCQGSNACKGLTTAFKNANIGCGSCNGDYSVSS
jgi:hypothetical protein